MSYTATAYKLISNVNPLLVPGVINEIMQYVSLYPESVFSDVSSVWDKILQGIYDPNKGKYAWEHLATPSELLEQFIILEKALIPFYVHGVVYNREHKYSIIYSSSIGYFGQSMLHQIRESKARPIGNIPVPQFLSTLTINQIFNCIDEMVTYQNGLRYDGCRYDGCRKQSNKLFLRSC